MPIPAGSGTSTPSASGPLFYDPRLSRVRLTVSGLMDGYPVRVERSPDGVRWTFVRGGSALVPSAGVVRLDDYEFTADVTNQYRVIGPAAWETFDTPTSGGWGTAGSGQLWTAVGNPPDHSVSGGQGRHTLSAVNATQESRLPVSWADLDVTVHGVGVSAAATGAPIDQAIAGRLVDGANFVDMRVFRTPSGAPTMALRQVSAGVETVPGFPSIAGATSGTLISLRLQAVGSTLRGKAWITGQPEPAAWLASMTATHLSAGAVAIRSLRETGNTNAGVVASYDGVVVTTPEATIYTGSIVPAIGGVWLKSIARPFLNRAVTAWGNAPEVTRPSRGGVFEVVGRSMPVAVTDVRGSRRWTLQVSTYSRQETNGLDLLLASGDPLLVHVPSTGRLAAVPGGYVTVGDTREITPPTVDLQMRVFEVPCVETAAPGPDVVGATATWQTVLSTYPTWQAVMEAHSMWADLMELVADPTEVVV